MTGAGSISFVPLSGNIISFKPQDETGTTFELKDHAPAFLDPYHRRYLVKDASGSLYTVADGALMQMEETELTAEVF